MPFRDQIVQRIVDAGGELRVKSALNPALWLCAVVTIPCLGLCSLYDNPPWWLVTIALVPVAITAIGFLFLLLFDRDKLQSEEYQIRKRSLELIQEKGDEFPVEPTSIDMITNPEKSDSADDEAEDS